MRSVLVSSPTQKGWVILRNTLKMATTLLESGPSLEEILSRYQLTETSLDNYCSHDIRNEIAVRLDDWEMIGYGLGFPRDKLRSIRRENDTEDLRKIALLDTWSRREGKGATYLKLARVLHVRQRCDLVELLCARFVSTRPEDGTRLSHTIDCCGPQGKVFVTGSFHHRYLCYVGATRGGWVGPGVGSLLVSGVGQ